jgi:hypothetical protein
MSLPAGATIAHDSQNHQNRTCPDSGEKLIRRLARHASIH